MTQTLVDVFWVWYAVMPFVTLAIGAAKGYWLVGWLCGLIPFLGLILVLRLPNRRRG